MDEEKKFTFVQTVFNFVAETDERVSWMQRENNNENGKTAYLQEYIR